MPKPFAPKSHLAKSAFCCGGFGWRFVGELFLFVTSGVLVFERLMIQGLLKESGLLFFLRFVSKSNL